MEIIANKKTCLVVLAVMLAITLGLGSVGHAYASFETVGLDVQAAFGNAAPDVPVVESARKTTEKSAQFSVKTYTDSKKYQYTTAKYRYERPMIKGSGQAVKKMNRALESDYADSLKAKKAMLLAAKGLRAADLPYLRITEVTPTYNKGGYSSFRYETNFMCGHPHPVVSHESATFSLKTGKRLNVAQVVAGNANQVKKKIANKFAKKYATVLGESGVKSAKSEIRNTNIGDFSFFLDKGNVVVEFDMYECGLPYVAGAGWVTLKGDYS